MSTFATAIFSLPNHSYCMASFDVSSLFANLPLDECIDHYVYQLFANRDITEHSSCNYDKVSLRKLLSFADKHNNFLFDVRLYDQTIMCSLEKFLDNCSPEFKPIIYRCCGDIILSP